MSAAAPSTARALPAAPAAGAGTAPGPARSSAAGDTGPAARPAGSGGCGRTCGTPRAGPTAATTPPRWRTRGPGAAAGEPEAGMADPVPRQAPARRQRPLPAGSDGQQDGEDDDVCHGVLPLRAVSTALRSAVLAAPELRSTSGARAAQIRDTSVTGTAASGP